ncbi:MAG: flavodoxin family protein [Candidatus Thorarchaeota archaeon]
MAKTIRVLGIVGSARRKGNTDILVDEVLRSVESNGGKTEKVYLSSLTIQPCRGCNTCEDTGKCIHNDDLDKLVASMKASDAWVFGSPVYFWGPTAQFKAFMDRWYGISREVFTGKRVVIVMPLGASSAHYARHAIGMIEDSCEYMKLDVKGSIIAPGVFEKGEVMDKPDILSLAKAAGSNLFD